MKKKLLKLNGKKEKFNYYEYFVKNTDYALQAAIIFKNFIENFDYTKSPEIEQNIHALESKADESHHSVLNYLMRDFLPPIDREDIVTLTHKIDNLCDNIDEVSINLNVLNIHQLKPEIIDFSKLLLECCTTTKDILVYLRDKKRYSDIQEKIISINLLEEQGDVLYQTSVKSLFSNCKDSIEILIWTRMYDCLENCYDACEDIASFVDNILLKNS